MYRFIIGLVFITLIISCKSSDKKESAVKELSAAIDSTLVSDSTWGLIRENASFDDLKKIYGDAAIQDERICGPECIDSIDVTKLFPSSKNEAIIYWKDSAYHKRISFITSYSEGAGWHTADSLKIGSAVTNLLRLNGKAIKFYGFGWDYGGTIISYNDGRFEKSPVNFELDKQYQEGDTSLALLGDVEFSSDSPEVQKEINKIIIRKISLSFYKEQ